LREERRREEERERRPFLPPTRKSYRPLAQSRESTPISPRAAERNDGGRGGAAASKGDPAQRAKDEVRKPMGRGTVALRQIG
jgi:hypothetical protein